MTQWYRNVGIDLGLKSAHQVTAQDPDGRRWRFRSGDRREDLERAEQRLCHDLPPGGKLRIFMEPTDTAWIPVAWFFMSRGHEVYLVSSSVVHDYRDAFSKHAKSDRIDSDTLADIPNMQSSMQRLKQIVWGSREQETLKRLVKHDFRLATSIGDRKKRIESLVRYGMATNVDTLDIFSAVGRYLCSHHFNPGEVVKAGVRALAVALAPLASFEAERHAQAWFKFCENAFAVYGEDGPIDYPVLEWECRTELKWLRMEEEERQDIQEAMADIYESVDPARNLETAPGVGPIVAAAVAAAIGDASRFPGPRQFRAYTGVVPKVDRSGVSRSKEKGITKAGPNWLKRALFLAADTARRIDPELGKVYHDQMVKYGHHHSHAVCAVATRLAERLFICYRDKRTYVIRDLEGNELTPAQGRAYVVEHLTVPEEVRKRLRRGTRQQKGKTRTSKVRANS